jgi:sigma-E factor negative regulatory protein RseA
MSSQENEPSQAQGLSALMDGHASAAEAQQLSQAWAQDGRLRQDWHLYQLIGDTLRSEELAQPPAHDRQFMARFSARLALEPVVLAPQALSSAGLPAALPPELAAAGRRASRARWAAPMTVAAGFMLVAGALLVLQNNGVWQDTGGASLAQLSTPDTAASGLASSVMPAGQPLLASTRSESATGANPALSPTYVVDGRLVRDPALDRYLQAHKEFGAGTALGVSTGYLRNASYDTPQP